MKINIKKTSRNDDGKIDIDGVFVDDIPSLTEQTTEADGYSILLSSGKHLFIPNDLTDRQAILDLIIRLADEIKAVNQAIPTGAPSPDVGTAIAQIKNDTNKAKEDLK